MPKQTSQRKPVELVCLSDDQTRVVSREHKRLTPKQLAQLKKANADWWDKKPGARPGPIIYEPSQAEAMNKWFGELEVREQQRAEVLESLQDPSRLIAYCEDWRKRILGPALKTAEEWGRTAHDCAADLLRTVWPSMERIGGATPPAPQFGLLCYDATVESVRDALRVAVKWCRKRMRAGTAGLKTAHIAANGVSLLDAALILTEEDRQLAREKKTAWQHVRTPKLPASIGNCPKHSQVKLFAPSAIVNFVEQVEGKPLCTQYKLRQRLIAKAREPRKK